MSNRARREHKEGNLYNADKEYSGCFRSKRGNGAMSKMQNVPAQRYSKMSNLKMETENSYPQRHSKMYNLDLVEYCQSKRSKKEILTMQIKNIVGRFMGGWDYGLIGQQKSSPVLKTSPYCPLAFKNAPAQRDSGIYILGMGLIGPMGLIGLMGQYPVMKTTPAQRDSGMSNLKTSPLCPYCLLCPLALKNSPAQRDSKMSN